MTNLADIRKQIEALEAQAAALVQKEKQGAIAQAKKIIAEFNLTATDLGFGGSRRASRGPRSGAAVKYRNAKGETWSGGRGRKPKWVSEALARGEDIEKYRVG